MPVPHPFDIAETCIAPPRGGVSRRLLQSEFRRAIEALGFRYWALCSHVDPLHPPAHAVLVHNYPAAWMKRFSKERLYEIDPILKRAERDPMPFFWDTAFEEEPITPAQRRILELAARRGLVHGYTVPIPLSWLPGALRASCSVIPGGAIEPSGYSLVQAIACSFYAALSRTRPRRQHRPIVLAPRERQCLALAAQGKDDQAIAEQLKLSCETVHWYFKRLRHRLGVRTRVQAVIRALECGLLSFAEVTSLAESGKPSSPTGG